MPVFQCETIFDAPLERVWDLHTTGEGLSVLTPSFFNLHIETVRGGALDEPLPEGAEIDVSTNPGDIGSRNRWTSVVIESEFNEETAVFRDKMRGGAFPEWNHIHRFETVFDGKTVMRDRIEYRLPTLAGDLVSPLAFVGFWPLFSYRHWKGRRILDSQHGSNV